MRIKTRALRTWGTLVLGMPLVLGGCILAIDDHDHGDDHDGRRKDVVYRRDGSVRKASARIEARSGDALHGEATFTEVEGGTLVKIHVEDAPPGWHAVHVHEIGDCSAEDGTSAGGHFNPDGHAHGAPHAPEHHAGDLGNMWVAEDGEGHHVILMPELTVRSGSHSVVGRAIIVHAGIDDLTSQPTGAAGGRIGCGEIR